jgi:hypothetical protein
MDTQKAHRRNFLDDYDQAPRAQAKTETVVGAHQEELLKTIRDSVIGSSFPIYIYIPTHDSSVSEVQSPLECHGLHPLGHREVLQLPFGPRPLIYADYTASGRSLSFIEDYIQSQVLPLYANTHTTATTTGQRLTPPPGCGSYVVVPSLYPWSLAGTQTSLFRKEAREVTAALLLFPHTRDRNS